MTEHAAKQPDSLFTPVDMLSSTILVQPDVNSESNIVLKPDNGGFVMLSHCQDVPSGLNHNPTTLQPDNLPTYYLSNAIGNAFQVCEAGENIDPTGSVPSLFVLQSNCDLVSAKESCDSLRSAEEQGSASWRPTESSVYYLTLHENVEGSSREAVTESHLLKVFQQDGIGTVVASLGKLDDPLAEDGKLAQNGSSADHEHEDAEEMLEQDDDVECSMDEETRPLKTERWDEPVL
jgi:hypothetical protein